MSKRIAISCPDHIHAVLSGLSELQSRPMSKIVVELLEASYPALNSVYMTLVRLEAEKRLANDSMATDVGAVVGDFKSSVEGLIAEIQLELEGVLPPYGNTGATYSQNNSKTSSERSVMPKLRGV